MTQLQMLFLHQTEVTDVGLEHLKGLTQLQWLWPFRDRSYRRGAGASQRLDPTPKMLSLGWNTKVTDAGLDHLTGLTQLKMLNLTATQVTDAGLEHLTGLTRLRELNLGETKVTDAGLEHLKGLTQLDSLHLAGSKVTRTGINGLQEALPNCLITPILCRAAGPAYGTSKGDFGN